MPNVALPETYFTRSIKLQYACPDAAIVREALQNSLDARSTRIKMTVSEDGVFEIDDDGVGMAAERMVSALLTFGGSEKEEGSVGGFGEAKVVLLFAHANFYIHSRDNQVLGRVLNYDLTKADFRQGTLIRIKFHEEYRFQYRRFLDSARQVLRESEFSIPVTLNGESEAGTRKGRCVRSFPWGKIFCSKLPGQTAHYSLVRSGGLCMFRHYVGAMDKSIVVEVTASPKEVFVATRDRLVDPHSKTLQEVFNELVVDRHSFGRKGNSRVLFTGEKGAIDDLVSAATANPDDRQSLEKLMATVVTNMRSVLDESVQPKRSRGGAPADIQRAVGVLNEVVGRMPLAPAQISFIKSNAQEIATRVCRHTFDFLIHIENTRYAKIPIRFEPSNLSAKNHYIAQLWKHCVKLVLRANGINSRFRIGWVLNETEAALRVAGSGSDNIPAFLLNPDFKDLRERSSSRKALFFHLLQVACHEVTHAFHVFHDESFGARLGTVTENALMHMQTWGAHCRAARHEIL